MDSTKELYGTGLLVFHVFCDLNNIPDERRCPISSELLAAFLASCAGAHSGSTLANYAAGIHAWHIVHGHHWAINEVEYKATLEGAARLAPSSSKRPRRAPFTTDILSFLHNVLDKDDPRDAAILACITISFFCLARLGEFTVPSIKSFDPKRHITRANYALSHNHEGLPVMVFHLPATKCSPKGETVQCAPQPDPNLDPHRALENHFRLNPAVESTHLFAWRHPTSGLRPLSKTEVTKKIATIARLHPDTPNLKGHSLRIGGTLFYLLNNVPFEVVKNHRTVVRRIFHPIPPSPRPGPRPIPTIQTRDPELTQTIHPPSDTLTAQLDPLGPGFGPENLPVFTQTPQSPHQAIPCPLVPSSYLTPANAPQGSAEPLARFSSFFAPTRRSLSQAGQTSQHPPVCPTPRARRALEADLFGAQPTLTAQLDPLGPGFGPENLPVFTQTPQSPHQAIPCPLVPSSYLTPANAVSVEGALLRPILIRIKHPFRTDRILIRLIVISVNSALWTALFGLLAVVFLVTLPQDMVFSGFYFPLCTLYCNTLLASLNVRRFVRGTDDGGSYQLPSVPSNSKLKMQSGSDHTTVNITMATTKAAQDGFEMPRNDFSQHYV
ncbi:hypothetical protein EDD15DRAFT_2368252 [Pisolithus albus]|nr:hypothetical protein EDD15DRAFT_2368252 [Pisolithus albus]